ncbi:MAG: PEGA domain-containing protein [Alphaproteobacteria bacterium]|nr:PEGA domain-containing protein [Alphaproteobacteria bacterium]
MGKKFLFFIAYLFLSCSVFANEVPHWVYKPLKDTESVKYFKGWGEGKTKSEAKYNAEKDVRYQAIAIFGEKIENSFEANQTFNQVDVIDRLEIKSKAILVSFEKQDEYALKKDDLWEYNILYAYPKKEIEKEKRRLDELSKNSEKKEVSTIGNDVKKGILTVDTYGISADLYIDGERYGEVPIRIVGKLNPGIHQIKIISPFFETYTSNVHIYPNIENKLKVRLKQGYGFLDIISNVDDTYIFVDSKKIGKAPMYGVKLQAGRASIIKAESKYAYSFAKEIVLEKDENKVINLFLEKKPSKINIFSKPSGAKIYLDDKLIEKNTPVINYTIPEGEHIISLRLPGYEIENSSITIKAGEEKKLDFTLKKKSEIREREINSTLKDKNHLFVISSTKSNINIFDKYNMYSSNVEILNNLGYSDLISNLGWSYLKPSFSYKNNQGQIILYVKIDFDDELYLKNYVNPLRKILSKFLVKGDTSILNMNCTVKPEDIGIWCGNVFVEDFGGNTFIRNGKITHNRLNDSAIFYKFSHSSAIDRPKESLNELKVVVKIFDKQNNLVKNVDIPFWLRPFYEDKKNLFFSPLLQKKDKSFCTIRRPFESGVSFKCGSESLLFDVVVEDINESQINKIQIFIEEI